MACSSCVWCALWDCVFVRTNLTTSVGLNCNTCVVYIKPLGLHAQGWLDIYHWYISLIYIGYISDIFVRKYRIFAIFIEFLYIFLMWHIMTMFWISVRVFCWLMTCARSIFSLLENFCQIAPLHSNAVWMTRVLHLICKARSHILLFGSKFHIILAMYVQMLDIYI